MKTLTNRIIRLRDNGNATYGVWKVFQGSDELLSVCTLEPSWMFNLKYISCIPTGRYHVKKRQSTKYGWHFHFQDVQGRTFILAHTGNLYSDSEGCIIVGDQFGYVNGDPVLDVKGSKSAMKKLLDLLPDEFLLDVMEHEHMQRFYTHDKPRTLNPV